MRLSEFILARVAEDEAVAREAIDPERPGTHWQWVDTETDQPSVPSDQFDGREYLTSPTSLRTVEEFPTAHVGTLPGFAISFAEEVKSSAAAHIARHDPARVLRQCEAIRTIVALYGPIQFGESYDGSMVPLGGDGPETYWDAVCALASIWADHPDYQTEWAE